MNFTQIMQGVPYTGKIDDCEIADITCDSREVKPGVLFACLKGAQLDGHDYAQQAYQEGSPVIIAEKDLRLPNQCIVKDSHWAYAKICANWYHDPAKQLKFIGVTGTNGKTTVSNLVKHILETQYDPIGLIGTIQNELGSQVFPAGKTTPDPKEFHELLFEMADQKARFVVMEVSSHALDQKRLADTRFSVGVFTNLTQDHLDYHGSMENYYQAKRSMFERCDLAVICVDDEYGKRLAKEVSCETLTFSAAGQKADYSACEIEMDVEGVRYTLKGRGLCQPIHFCTPGLFSVHNSMAAAIACLSAGLSAGTVAKALDACPPVKGRSESIPTHRDFTVICDYAHSPDGIKNILDSVNEYKTGRVVTVFGCGGDRDRTKRPLMGEAAAANSDLVIVTSDNPRTEDPDAIIDEILPGVQRSNVPYLRITDRIKAIQYAVTHALPGDIIVLAGKGHEDYQVIGTKKVHLDEREVVAQALRLLDEREQQ